MKPQGNKYDYKRNHTKKISNQLEQEDFQQMRPLQDGMQPRSCSLEANDLHLGKVRPSHSRMHLSHTPPWCAPSLIKFRESSLNSPICVSEVIP